MSFLFLTIKTTKIDLRTELLENVLIPSLKSLFD